MFGKPTNLNVQNVLFEIIRNSILIVSNLFEIKNNALLFILYDVIVYERNDEIINTERYTNKANFPFCFQKIESESR